MTSEDLVRAIIWIGLFVLVAGPVHECAHAFTAWKLGDGTAKLFGRVTLNPIPHIDPVGALMIVVSSLAGWGLGWAKPTPVNPYNLRGRHADSIVAAAGPISNLGLAFIFAVLYRVLPDQAADIYAYTRSVPGILSLICVYGVTLNVGLMIFNLIPVPPLDGSHVLLDFLDPRTSMQLRPIFSQYGIFLLFLIIIPFGGQSVVGAIFEKVAAPFIRFLLGW